MKKLKAFLTLSICLIAALMFVGCGEKEQPTLSVPNNLAISTDKVVKFSVVENATYYVINVNEVSYSAYLNSNPKISTVDGYVLYDAKEIMHQNIVYNVKVKAGAEGYKESEYSQYAYLINSIKLNKPTLEVVGTTATWDVVENAEFYNLKVVLPADQENGEANLITYKVWGKNYYDFSALLGDVGEYKFSVSAGNGSGYYVDSDYSDVTAKAKYVKSETLSAPANTKIHTKDGKYYLLTIVDEHTTDLYICVDGVETYVPLTSEYVKLDETNKNFVEVNLSDLFVATDFEENKDYQFKVKNIGGNFYSASATSELTVHLNYATLSPTSATYNAGSRTLSWTKTNEDGAIGYNVYVVTSEGVNKIYYDKQYTQYILPEDFISAYVQVVGKDATVKNSIFSNAISKSSANLGEIEIYKAYISPEGIIQPAPTGEFNCIGWTSIPGAEYIVEFADQVLLLGDDCFVRTDVWLENYKLFVLHAYKEGCKELTRAFSLTEKITLSSPKNKHVEIENPTLIKFDASAGAYGYRLFVTDKQTTEDKWAEICEEYATEQARQNAFNAYLKEHCVSRLFATNEIDAKPYINTVGAYKMYVQAVADPYSAYVDSELKYEDGLNVSLFYTLESPELFKNAQGELEPIEEYLVSGNKHYVLKFYGVEGASVYDISITYGVGTEKVVTINHDRRPGCYETDITSYILEGGVYTIKVRARYTGDEALILPSSYAQFTYTCIMQLKKVENIRVSTSGDIIVTFDEQPHALGGYFIDIKKVGDPTYPKCQFTISGSGYNISDYIAESGAYTITITAKALNGDLYYIDSEPNTCTFYV